MVRVQLERNKVRASCAADSLDALLDRLRSRGLEKHVATVAYTCVVRSEFLLIYFAEVDMLDWSSVVEVAAELKAFTHTDVAELGLANSSTPCALCSV